MLIDRKHVEACGSVWKRVEACGRAWSHQGRSATLLIDRNSLLPKRLISPAREGVGRCGKVCDGVRRYEKVREGVRRRRVRSRRIRRRAASRAEGVRRREKV